MTDARSIPGRENCRADTAETCRGKKVGAHCRSCLMIARRADPEAEARRVAKLSQNFDSDKRAIRSAAMKAMHARKANDPQHHEMLRKSGQRLQQLLSTPEMRARMYSPETIKRRARTCSNRQMADVPLEYRDMARELVRTGKGTKAEVRKIIRDQMKADEQRYRRTGQLQASKGERR